jgi:hypothetical protein
MTTTIPPLTYDEHKAAEAAFHGLPLDPKWSRHAQEIYLGILAVTDGRDIVKTRRCQPWLLQRNLDHLAPFCWTRDNFLDLW